MHIICDLLNITAHATNQDVHDLMYSNMYSLDPFDYIHCLTDLIKYFVLPLLLMLFLFILLIYSSDYVKISKNYAPYILRVENVI